MIKKRSQESEVRSQKSEVSGRWSVVNDKKVKRFLAFFSLFTVYCSLSWRVAV